MQCPNCHKDIDSNSTECMYCKIVLQPKTSRPVFYPGAENKKENTTFTQNKASKIKQTAAQPIYQVKEKVLASTYKETHETFTKTAEKPNTNTSTTNSLSQDISTDRSYSRAFSPINIPENKQNKNDKNLVDEINQLIGTTQTSSKQPLANTSTRKNISKINKPIDTEKEFSETNTNQNTIPTSINLEETIHQEAEAPLFTLNKVLTLNNDDIPLQDKSRTANTQSVREPISQNGYNLFQNTYYRKEENTYYPISQKQLPTSYEATPSTSSEAHQSLNFSNNSTIMDNIDELVGAKKAPTKTKFILFIVAAITSIIAFAILFSIVYPRTSNRASANLNGNTSTITNTSNSTYTNNTLTAENYTIKLLSVEVFNPTAKYTDARKRLIFSYEMTNTGKSSVTPENPLSTRFRVSEDRNNEFVTVESTDLPNEAIFNDYKAIISESLPVGETRIFKKSYTLSPDISTIKLNIYDAYSTIIATEEFSVENLATIN